MPPDPIITETPVALQSSFHIRPSLLVVLLITFGMLVVTLMVFPQWNALTTHNTQENLVEADMVPEVLDGTIYLSLAPLDENGSVGSLGIYAYEVSSDKLTPVLSGGARHYLTSEISPSGTSVALASLGDDHDEPMRLYVGDIHYNELEEVAMHHDIIAKRNPTWSPDGSQIAFMGRGNEQSDDLDVEAWGVYLYDIESMKLRQLTTGSNPQFLPNGNLLVLKQNGINLVDTATAEVSLLIEAANNSAKANMKFDVSRDGTKIAWALPDNHRVNVIEVSSWAPFVATTTHEIGANAFWPVFSPQGEYLAMEVFDWDSNDGLSKHPVNQRLVVYSFTDRSWTDVAFDLVPFYQESMYITDWK